MSLVQSLVAPPLSGAQGQRGADSAPASDGVDVVVQRFGEATDAAPVTDQVERTRTQIRDAVDTAPATDSIHSDTTRGVLAQDSIPLSDTVYRLHHNIRSGTDPPVTGDDVAVFSDLLRVRTTEDTAPATDQVVGVSLHERIAFDAWVADDTVVVAQQSGRLGADDAAVSDDVVRSMAYTREVFHSAEPTDDADGDALLERWPTDSANSVADDLGNRIDSVRADQTLGRLGSDFGFRLDDNTEKLLPRRTIVRPLSHAVFSMRAPVLGLADYAVGRSQHDRVAEDTAPTADAAAQDKFSPREGYESARATDSGDGTVFQFRRNRTTDFAGVRGDDVQSSIFVGRELEHLIGSMRATTAISGRRLNRQANDRIFAFDEPVPPNTHVRRASDTAKTTDRAEKGTIYHTTEIPYLSASMSASLRVSGKWIRLASDAIPPQGEEVTVGQHLRRDASDLAIITSETTDALRVSQRTAEDDAPASEQVESSALHERTAEDTAPAADNIEAATRRDLVRTAEDATSAIEQVQRSVLLGRYGEPSEFYPLAESATVWSAHSRTGDEVTEVADGATRHTQVWRTPQDVAPFEDGPTAEGWVSLRYRLASDSAPWAEVLEQDYYQPRQVILWREVADVVPHPDDSPYLVQRHMRQTYDGGTTFDEAWPSTITGRQALDEAPATDEVQHLAPKVRDLFEDALGRDNEFATRLVEQFRTAADDANEVPDDRLPDAVESWSALFRSPEDTAPAADTDASRSLIGERRANDFVPVIDLATLAQILERSPGEDISLPAGVEDLATRLQVLARLIEDSAPATDDTTSSATVLRSAEDQVPTPVDLATLFHENRRFAYDYAPAMDAIGLGTSVSLHGMEDISLPDDTAERVTYQPRDGEDIAFISDAVVSLTQTSRLVFDQALAIDLPAEWVKAIKAAFAQDEAGIGDEASGYRSQFRDLYDVAPAMDFLVHLAQQFRAVTDAWPSPTDAAERGAMVSAREAEDAWPTPHDMATGGPTLIREAEDSVKIPAEDYAVRFAGYFGRTPGDDASADDVVERVLARNALAYESLWISDEAVSTGRLARVVLDALAIADTADRTQVLRRVPNEQVWARDAAAIEQALGRSAADLLRAVDWSRSFASAFRDLVEVTSISDAAERQRETFGFGQDAAPADDLVIRLLAATRETRDRAPNYWDIPESLVEAWRWTQDSAPTSDDLGHLPRHVRDLLEVLSTSDAPTQVGTRWRTSNEPPAFVGESATRQTEVTRDLAEVWPVSESPGSQMLAFRIVIEAAPAEDLVAHTVTLYVPYGPPVVIWASLDRLKVSEQPGFTQAVLDFVFDQPVGRWEVRVGSTGPLDGVLVEAYEGEPTTSGEAEIGVNHLRVGGNDVAVYGRSLAGTWTR